MSPQIFTGVADGFHFAVAGWILLVENAVMTASDNLVVFYNNRTEGAAVAVFNAGIGFLPLSYIFLS